MATPAAAAAAATGLTVTLRNGLRMPQIGLGTYRIRGQDAITKAISGAVAQSGYKLIDTAAVYRNEVEIAAALSSLKLDRSELFLTSKLQPKDQGLEKARAAIQKTLKDLNTDYLDLYLIHWPGGGGLDVTDPRNKTLRLESWSVLEEFHRKGILRSIGVSNYSIAHLQELLPSDSCDGGDPTAAGAAACPPAVVPHVNQIEIHPHFQQRELVQFCRDQGIHVTAYSSLGRTVEVSPLLTDPVIAELSLVYGKSPAQILLKWAVAKGFSILPKSTNPKHIQENVELGDFEISPGDMDKIDGLERQKKYAWDPRTVV